MTVLLHAAWAGAGCGGGGAAAGLGLGAVDDVLFLADREAARARDVGLDRDEHHLSAASGLGSDVLDRRLAAHLVADAQAFMERRALAREHAPRQWDRR